MSKLTVGARLPRPQTSQDFLQNLQKYGGARFNQPEEYSSTVEPMDDFSSQFDFIGNNHLPYPAILDIRANLKLSFPLDDTEFLQTDITVTWAQDAVLIPNSTFTIAVNQANSFGANRIFKINTFIPCEVALGVGQTNSQISCQVSGAFKNGTQTANTMNVTIEALTGEVRSSDQNQLAFYKN